jgi:hypothetical protein
MYLAVAVGYKMPEVFSGSLDGGDLGRGGLLPPTTVKSSSWIQKKHTLGAEG